MSQYDIVLRRALIAEKVCDTNTEATKTIQNPYGSAGTATIQAVAGTYGVSTWTVTDDALTVTDEVILAEHIFAHEEFFAVYDIAMSRIDAMTFAVKDGIDKYVLNALCEDATGAYTVPAGGFVAANVVTIFSEILGKVAGYENSYNGLYIAIENTEVPALVQAGAANGFTSADMVLRNGLMTNYMGVDIYVTRTGTFVDATIGTRTVTNSGHRVAGVKKVATYASPRGMQYDERKVAAGASNPGTGRTGYEILIFGLVGFKLWAQKASLTIDITL